MNGMLMKCRTVMTIMALGVFVRISSGQEPQIWKSERKIITVTRVHVPEGNSHVSIDADWAFVESYLKKDAIGIEKGKFLRLFPDDFIDKWRVRTDKDGKNLQPSPVGLELPEKYYILSIKNNEVFLLCISEIDSRLIRLFKPVDEIDLFCIDVKSKPVHVRLPHELQRVLAEGPKSEFHKPTDSVTVPTQN